MNGLNELRDAMFWIGDRPGVLIGIVLVASLAVLAVWAWLVYSLLRRLTVDRAPESVEALRQMPLALALGVDAIDLGLDFFGAPIVYALLSRGDLRALRRLTLFESLLPGTQLIPSLTISWLYAHHAGDGTAAETVYEQLPKA